MIRFSLRAASTGPTEFEDARGERRELVVRGASCPAVCLGVLEPSVVFQVNRDAGCLPGVTSDWSEKTRRLGPVSTRV